MLRFLYDWLVLAPADLFAGRTRRSSVATSGGLWFGAGALVYALIERRRRPDGAPRTQYTALTIGWLVGLYLGVRYKRSHLARTDLISRILN
jgi:hypothetical protein